MQSWTQVRIEGLFVEKEVSKQKRNNVDATHQIEIICSEYRDTLDYLRDIAHN